MLPTSLRHTLSVLVAAAILAGPATLTATPTAAEEMSANEKAQKAAKARRKAMERLKKARAAKAKRAKAKAARAKAARAKARAAKKKAAKAKAAKAAKAKAAKAKAAKEKAAKEKAAMERAAKAKSKSPEMAKPKTTKSEKAKPKMAKPKSGDKQTQTALSAQPMTKLAKLARTINEHMTAGEADGSLTKGELARLASLKERVEIMDRMSRNDENFSTWERHYLETANTILKDIIQRHRLDREMSVEPRHIEMRIQRGVHDGTLTEQQAENLREVQRRILVARNEADQDGSLSAREKTRYWRAQYRLSDLLNHTRRYGPVARTLGQSGFKEALQRGVKNGSFSRTEARELWRTHQRIRGLREKAIADGKITAIELTVLNKRLKAERHRLSYGERAAYRRSLRKRRRIARGRSRAGGGSGAANRGAAAVRNYGRSVGRGMRSLGRTFGR